MPWNTPPGTTWRQINGPTEYECEKCGEEIDEEEAINGEGLCEVCCEHEASSAGEAPGETSLQEDCKLGPSNT